MPRHDGSVAGHAAARSDDCLRGNHTVIVVGAGFVAPVLLWRFRAPIPRLRRD
jgi:hypothetical protein